MSPKTFSAGNTLLVLASSSPYRHELLRRLKLPFVSSSPAIDETPKPGEAAGELAQRLAAEKARALRTAYPNHLIIGCDQVAEGPDKSPLGKPGNMENACHQLARCSGKNITFYTGLSLFHSGQDRQLTTLETYEAHFRQLDAATIERYVTLEKPFDCAGSFRMEGMGIALFERLHGRDPNTLIGLPLIALVDALAEFGISVIHTAQAEA